MTPVNVTRKVEQALEKLEEAKQYVDDAEEDISDTVSQENIDDLAGGIDNTAERAQVVLNALREA